MRPLLALAIASTLALAGCVEIEPARVPDRLLEGTGGNGWEKNLSASEREPDSSQGGFAKSQTLVYEDRARGGDGHPGSLTVTTLRTFFRPSETDTRDRVQDAIRAEAEARGIRIEGGAATGARQLANGADSLWFVYNGSVERSGTLFRSTDARVKVYGEVFQCEATKGVVVAVGLAQVSDVRSVGGVRLPTEDDPLTWWEIASDPRGSIEGIRGSDGLAYGIQC